MDKRKKLLTGAVIAVVIILIVGGAIGYKNYRDYHNTYILIDEIEYRRDSAQLDLSGQSIAELEKLKELTQLQTLNLRDTGITTAQYDDLHAALPDCQILWSVPFQGGYLDNTIEVLPINTLSEADIAALAYLPNLTRIKAGGCRDYEALFQLMEQYPQIQVSYDVPFGNQTYFNGYETLEISDPDVDEMITNLQYLPKVTTVNLTGDLPSTDELMRLREAYPEITFVWEFEVCGVTVNTLTEFVDLSGIEMESVDGVESMLPYFYNLTQVDMCGCGISNEDMDALNKRYPDIKFVWTVKVYRWTLRTDAEYFMPAKLGASGTINGSALRNLRYCTDMVVLDLGHFEIGDASFVEYMPNLKYLLLCECDLTDLTSIGKCTSLEYLELSMNALTDYWPLTNLTNLRDLALSTNTFYGYKKYGSFGDVTPLLQMTWLDRLWLSKTIMTNSNRNLIRQALQNTTLVFFSSGATTSGFRYTPRYFQQRDILGMDYFHN